LLERTLGHDLGWTERDLRALRELGPNAATLAPTAELQAHALESIRRWVSDPHRVGKKLTAAAFGAAAERAKADLRGIVPRLQDLLREILALRQGLLVHPTPPPGLDDELSALMSPDFLRATPFEQLAHFPRYLKAKKIRADRWRQNPAKDAERMAQIRSYVKDLAVNPELRWLVEEFRVSLFAQELGTATAVSKVKLDRAFAAATSGGFEPKEEPVAPSKPIVIAPVIQKKTAPLKNLGALDKLFPRG
jgi:ATP-dependent helicase HrpA